MKNTLKVIFLTILCLGVFALGEYFATNNIFNIFDDRLLNQALESTSSAKVLTEEPTGDIISDVTNITEVYKGNNDANNETNTLTLYENHKYILEAKSSDQESTRIGWFEQDENFVILHEKYYSTGDTRMFESPSNTVLILHYTNEGTLNISSIFDKRTIKMFKLSESDGILNAPKTDYSTFTLIKEG